MHIIGLSGKAGSGKDTAADYIQSEFESRGYTVARLSFAKYLKDICTMLFGWDRKRLDTDPYYKEGGLGGWVPKGSPGARPIEFPSCLPHTSEEYQRVWYDQHVELDSDPACLALGMTRRVIMQKVGTECFRDGLDKNIWIIVTQLCIDRGEMKSDIGLITDCRYLNETTFVSKNGVTVKIERPNVATHTNATQHDSENEWLIWKEWSYVVKNDGTLDQFRTKLDVVIDAGVDAVDARNAHVR